MLVPILLKEFFNKCTQVFKGVRDETRMGFGNREYHVVGFVRVFSSLIKIPVAKRMI